MLLEGSAIYTPYFMVLSQIAIGNYRKAISFAVNSFDRSAYLIVKLTILIAKFGA